MEKAMDWEQKTLITELTQGRELTNQLKTHLDSASSPQTTELLLEKILSSYEKALSMLNWGDLLESNKSIAASGQRRENFDHDSKDQCQKDVFKKRKVSSPRWSQQVSVYSGTRLGGPLDDGYSWRKYGQKDILGSKFPRAYYRCTHRNGQGCLATKQVQKSDEDPSMFEITYRGRHTCIQSSHLGSALAYLGKQDPKENKYNCHPKEEQIQEQTQEMVMELASSEEKIPPFSFPSTPIASENVESHFFPQENNFMGSCSPPFISPATSESNYFMNNNYLGMAHNLQSSDSDIGDIISAPTSGTNSPIGLFDFSLDKVDFDSDFPLDIMEFFS